MTDNRPATDEQIAAWENETHIMPSDLYTFILSLIARIRAEQNNGEVVAYRNKDGIFITPEFYETIAFKQDYYPLYATPVNSFAKNSGEVAAATDGKQVVTMAAEGAWQAAMVNEEALDKAAREGYAVRCKTHGPRTLAKYASDDIMKHQLDDARVIIEAYLSASQANNEGRAWDGNSIEALIDQYANGIYIGKISKPPLSVCVEHLREFATKLLALATPANSRAEVDERIVDAVIDFFVKHDMLDERDEYDLSDVIGALWDNYEPISQCANSRAEAIGEEDLDWVKVAKLSNEYGVRYATNKKLVDFVNAILFPLDAPQQDSRAEAIGSRETDSPLLAASYYAMSKAMELLDADLGHGTVLNMLAKCRCDIENRRALLDNPQPDSRAEAIVKPLDWKAVRKAVIGADGYEITDMSAGNKQGWRGSFPGENTYRWFSTIEDAQDAAQGHYLRALLQQEGE